MKLRWKEAEDKGGPERKGMIILSTDMLLLQIGIMKNLIPTV